MNRQPLDVLIVLPTAVLGGAERVMFNLADYLLGEGHRVTVYVMSRGGQPGWTPLKTRGNFSIIEKEFASERTSLFAFVVALWQLSSRERFDYIFSTHTHVNAVLSFLRKIRVVRCERLVGRESTFIFERFFGLRRLIFYVLYRFFYGSHDLLICQTNRMRASLLTNLGFQPACSVVALPNPVSVANIERLGAEPVSAVMAGAMIVVSCGRLIPIKGFDLLIRAFATVSSKHQRADLIIVGDGPDKERLTALARSLGIEDRVRLVGRLENPFVWFKVADVGVISSEREGFPNVLIEMMAVGVKNIISTPCSDGVFDVPGINVLSDYDVGCMAEALDSALASPVDRADLYRKYIRDERTVDAFWTQINNQLDGCKS